MYIYMHTLLLWGRSIHLFEECCLTHFKHPGDGKLSHSAEPNRRGATAKVRTSEFAFCGFLLSAVESDLSTRYTR